MNTTITDQAWVRTHYLLEQLPRYLKEIRDDITHLQTELDRLANVHCTGKAHWRDTNNSNKTPKLYVIHGTNSVCPIHGTPEPGSRIRSYIGSNPEKITRAQDAMRRCDITVQLTKEYNHLSRKLRHGLSAIMRIYWSLGITPPKPSEDQAGDDEALIHGEQDTT